MPMILSNSDNLMWAVGVSVEENIQTIFIINWR
jgi:hypothetical protein